jgi:hypothetical protein
MNEKGSMVTVTKIQSTSSNAHMSSHSVFQRENKKNIYIDLEVIILLLVEAGKSF